MTAKNFLQLKRMLLQNESKRCTVVNYYATLHLNVTPEGPKTELHDDNNHIKERCHWYHIMTCRPALRFQTVMQPRIQGRMIIEFHWHPVGRMYHGHPWPMWPVLNYSCRIQEYPLYWIALAYSRVFGGLHFVCRSVPARGDALLTGPRVRPLASTPKMGLLAVSMRLRKSSATNWCLGAVSWQAFNLDSLSSMGQSIIFLGTFWVERVSKWHNKRNNQAFPSSQCFGEL